MLVHCSVGAPSTHAGQPPGAGRTQIGRPGAAGPDLPRDQGRGVGREMLQFLESLAGNHGVITMRLDATLNAAPFYRRCGWTGDLVSTYRNSRGLELACVPMTKRLDGPV